MHLEDTALSFLSILLEGLPFVLLGTLISGLVDAFVPASWITRWLPRHPLAAIGTAGLLGIVFPVCECGVVPVIRRLMIKGLPAACAIAYMLAAPVVNPVTALSTWAAFRGQSAEEMTLLRLLLAYGLAVAIAWAAAKIPLTSLLRPQVLDALAREPGLGSSGPGGSIRTRLGRAATTTAVDFTDVTCFLVLGAALTAMFNTAVPQTMVEPLAEHPALAVAGMMTLAYVLALCSTSDAFIAAVFFAFAPAAKLAFLVFGPVMDIKLTLLYATTFRRRWIAALGITLFLATWLLCLKIGGRAL